MSELSYPFDPTGLSAANLVANEIHTLTEINSAPYRIIIPKFSPFYLDNLQLNYVDEFGVARPLTLGVDYTQCLMYVGAMRSIGKAIYGGLSINNSLINGQIKITYQTLGGEWTADANEVMERLANIVYNPRTTIWDVVTNKPNQFPPINHNQSLDYIYDKGDLINALNEIANALLQGSSGNGAPLTAHLADTGNPHQVTKDQVGLGSVQNLPVATTEEILAQEPVNKYILLSHLVALGLADSQLATNVNNLLQVTNDILDRLSNSNDVSLDGPRTVAKTSVTDYYITDFDSFKTYTTQAINGTVSYDYGTITYTAPEIAGTDTLTVNNKNYQITVVDSFVNTPSIINPINNAVDLSTTLTFASDTFSTLGGTDIHAASDWQIATDSNFTNVVSATVNNITNKTDWTINSLTANTTYYARVRYRGMGYGYSEWSNPIQITTKNQTHPTVEQAKLIGNDSQPWDFFAINTVIDATGTYAVVGSPYANAGPGAVYIFKRSGTTWAQEAKILPDDSTDYDEFGTSICIDATGTRIAVGKPKTENNSGAVYVFVRSGTTWTQEAKLTHNVDFTYYLGHTVAIDATGSRIVSGAKGTVANGTIINGTTLNSVNNEGSIFIFNRTGTSWNFELQLFPNERSQDARFGSSVAIDGTGTRIVVNAVGLDINENPGYSGSVYVFVRSGTTWTQELRLTATDLINADTVNNSVQLTAYVSIDDAGMRMVIGTPYLSTNSQIASGIVYIYKRVNTTWIKEAKITQNVTADNNNLGFSVNISRDGSTVAMSSYSSIVEGILTRAVHIYNYENYIWAEQVKLVPNDILVTEDLYRDFGISICLNNDGSMIIIGDDVGNAGSGNTPGAAYIFA